MFAISLLTLNVYAGTKVVVTSGGGTITVDGQEDLEKQVDDIVNKNGPFISNSFAMANLTGYPVGESHIGSFPHMQFGIALGMGGTNMRFFDKNDPASNNGTMPGITPNAVLNFGLGLGEKTDILGKLFVLNKSIIDPGVKTDIAELTHYNIISTGGKFRYQLFGKQTLLPFLFNFGGLTISAGFDMMYGNIRVQGNYDATYDAEVNWGPIQVIPLDFGSDYEGKVLWGIFGITTQAIAYFEVFGIFQPYTGFGISANYGYFIINFDAAGDLVCNDPSYTGSGGTNPVGTMLFTSRNGYNPYYVIPTYIVGLELNLWLIKITAETMANLYNLRDINAQLGVRVQF
ncbi:MAG: hypothetical protein EPN93_15550 [Spirochaetes bacterium]|nr:MAG: hypothetical protein EPN93_15550 [Spirochaetota bacterium]